MIVKLKIVGLEFFYKLGHGHGIRAKNLVSADSSP
jgi:hypothetical protein